MTIPSSRTSRRAQQRRERRRGQVRLIATVVGLLVAVAVGFALYLAFSSPEPPSREPAVAVASGQDTLLLQVRGADGIAFATALLAHEPDEGVGSVVLIPPQVLVNVPGTGSMPLGRAVAASSEQGSRDALSDLMGVAVGAGWVLDEASLVTLVNALGGVAVDVDVQVVRDQTVVLGPGEQLVDGARALELARYLVEGEQEQARLARLQEVIDGVIAALPPTAADITVVLQQLGEGSVSTAALGELADLLVGLAADDQQSQLQYDVLPVVDLDPGGDVTASRVDVPALTALVDRLLSASVLAGAREGNNRVLVLNGVGTPGLGEAVRAKLVPAGFVFVDARNADRFGYATTQVLVPEATQEAQALGKRVAEALGLPDATIATQEFGTVADVVVVIGADFQP